MLRVYDPGDRDAARFVEREGQECIYAEKRSVGLARIVRVRVDNWGIEMELQSLAAAGCTLPEEPWTASCAWGEFRESSMMWVGSPWAAWIVSFDPKTRERVLGAALEQISVPPHERGFLLRLATVPPTADN